MASASSLCLFDRDILEGCGVGEIGNQAEPRLSDPRSDAVEKTELPDRRVDHPLREDLLHFIKDRGTLLVVKLDRLLLVERIDVRVVAIDIRAALDDECFKAGRSVAKGAAAAEDQVF